jgi:hypothetical protein
VAAERFPVEEGHILAFARAIGDTNPAYVGPDAVAPPTFVIASAQFDPDYPLRPKPGQRWFGSGSTPSGRTAGGGGGSGSGGGDGGSGGGGGGGGLHAEQRFEYHRPLRAGDVLTATTTRGRTWEKQGRRGGKLLFAESVTEYRDADGELVVTATSVGVRTEKVPEQPGGGK